MKGTIFNEIRYRLFAGVFPEGKWGLKILGHRLYVGGKWNKIGKLQFEYLVNQGLQPSNCFLDIGCGSLRGGVHFIPYLDVGNYLGLDKEPTLVQKGIDRELGKRIYEEKHPEFVFSDKFEFHKFSKKPEFSLALSLFTHLNSHDIELCLNNLRHFVQKGHVFFATFFEGDSSGNKAVSDSLDHFKFSREEMVTFGENANWQPHYIGDWSHPRDLMMIRYTAI